MRKIFVIALFFLLTGCGSLIQTQKIEREDINEGISYYLPKRPHNLVITAEITNPKKNKTILEQAIKAYSMLDAEAKKLKEEWEKLQRKADNTPDGGDARKKAIEAAQNAEGAYRGALMIANSAKNEMNVAKASYQRILDSYSDSRLSQVNEIINDINNLREKLRENPKLKDKITLDKRYADHIAIGCDYQLKMDITPLALIPDTRHPLFLKIDHSHLRDDELKIKTTSTGLITTSDVITTDRTGDIIIEIAKAVAMFGIGIPLPSTLPVSPVNLMIKVTDELKKPKRCNYSVMRYEQIVDFEKEIPVEFFGENGSETLVTDFDYLIPTLKVKVKNSSCSESNQGKQECKSVLLDTFFDDTKWPKKDDSRDFNIEYQKRKNGILYRRDEAHEVQLVANRDKILISRQVMMPNISPISLAPFHSLPLVTTKNNAGFENGMLVSFDTNQPSSVLELVRLPAKVVEGMFSAVTKLIQLKIDYASKNTGLISEEVKHLEEIQKLKDAIKNQVP